MIADTDSATRTLATWCGEPPTTHIHTREEAATLPQKVFLLGLPPTTTVQRRHITHRRRDGTVLCEARAIVWLDSPALPGPVVTRLRTGPQPLGEGLGRWACGGARSAPAGCATTAGRWSTRLGVP